LETYIDSGHFGRKSGQGVYHYENTIIDPDLNPILDQNNNPIKRMENPSFDTLHLTAPMVNEAFRVLEEGIVKSCQDVETCIDLGARWPKGPFQLAKEIGFKNIVETLKARAQASGETHRYEASRLLTDPNDELQAYLEE
jgi:3-hydroxyacyl-CoA dehydrogenase